MRYPARPKRDDKTVYAHDKASEEADARAFHIFRKIC